MIFGLGLAQVGRVAFCGKGAGMTKRKYSEVEMIGALKQMEAGRSAAEVGREMGVSKHTI
jgi:Transposase